LKIKERIIGIINQMDFSEYLEEKSTCPECKEKSLIRHIQKEPNQKWKGQWFVEHCSEEDCAYWNCGFLSKKYKPQSEGKYRHISNESKKIKVKKNNE